MSFNRLMMKNGKDLKNIKAMMTVGPDFSSYGFKKETYGSLSPNPLPNGVLVESCYAKSSRFYLSPSSIKSCTINNITVNSSSNGSSLYQYLKQNSGKTIPVIFHFD